MTARNEDAANLGEGRAGTISIRALLQQLEHGQHTLAGVVGNG